MKMTADHARRIVRIQLQPAQRAYVTGIPVRLRESLVSVSDPAALAAALGFRTAE